MSFFGLSLFSICETSRLQPSVILIELNNLVAPHPSSTVLTHLLVFHFVIWRDDCTYKTCSLLLLQRLCFIRSNLVFFILFIVVVTAAVVVMVVVDLVQTLRRRSSWLGPRASADISPLIFHRERRRRGFRTTLERSSTVPGREIQIVL